MMRGLCVFLLVTPLIGLMINALSHVMCSRRFAGGRHLTAILAGFTAGFLTQAGLGLFFWPRMPYGLVDNLAHLAMSAFMYVALAYGYFVFINLNVTSLRIRILKELYTAGNEGLPGQTLLSLYNPNEIFETRMRRLANWGQLVENGNRYLPRGRGFWIAARIILIVKFIVLGKPLRRKSPHP